MRKNGYKRRWLCGVLALISGFVLPGAVQANSGLSDTMQAIDGFDYYIGVKGASGNEVIIDSDVLGVGAVGGYAKSDSDGYACVEKNSVIMSGGTVQYIIYGGWVQSNSGAAHANYNSVTMSGGTVGNIGNIYGGRAQSDSGAAHANYNSVTMSGGTVGDIGANIYGGRAQSNSGVACADYNSVIMSGGTVGNIGVDAYGIYGGQAQSNFDAASANYNSVTMNGGTVNGTILGGSADTKGGAAHANYNSVTISGGMVGGGIFGGWANSENGDAYASNNSILMSGGTVGGDIYGGLANSYSGGKVYSNYASNNRVTVSGGDINGNIYGGYVRDFDSGSATAANNIVMISDGTITGEVYGGYAEGAGSKVKGNSVTLSGTADVSGADLYGSNLSASGTNNNLVINGWSGAVNSLNNFDHIQVRALAGGLDLTAGKRTVFVNTAEGIHGGSLNPTEAKEMQAGVALTVSGDMGISEDNKDIYIDVTGVRVRDQTVIATESRAASVAAVGRGAEAVTDSLDTLRGSEEGLSTFASIIGSRSRYNTGSHADVNGWNGIVGTAWTRELTSGTLSCGAFYENGGGSYDTYNTINGRTYRGDGDTVYNGGGLLLRWETNGGTYTEASLRAGMVKNEAGPSLEFAGNRYGFKTENNYYGGHVGIGRIMERDDGDAWDIYGKYFHMHHEGDTVTIAGDEFAFDSVNSDRLRVGARYLDRKNDRFTGYYGLAYEYEFSGDTGGTANHHAMYTPSLQGSTVIGEIGFRGTPGENSPWSFEVSLRGYAGKQEGISGAVTAAYSF